MPRSRRPRRARPAAASAGLLALFIVGTAVAAPAPSRPAAETPHPAVERDAAVRGATARGHVVAERVGTPVKAAAAVPVGGPEPSSDGPDIAAVDPAQATTNGAPAPTLGSTAAAVRDAAIPAPMIAVGPDHQVRADEGIALMNDRTGGGALSVPFSDLFLLPPGTSVVTARIWYEASRGRWVAVGASRDCDATGTATFGHGNLDIAVSDSADPTAGWSSFFFAVDDALISSPGLGTTTDKLVVTSRVQPMTTGCAPTGSAFWDITTADWNDMLAGGDDNAAYFSFEDDPIEWLVPAVQQPATNALGIVVGQEAGHPLIIKIAGTDAATAITDVDDLTDLDVIPSFGDAPAVPQGSGSFQPSARPTSVVARASRIVIGHTETCTPTGDDAERACARVTDLVLQGDGTIRRQDFYLAQSGSHTYSPGLGFALDGKLMLSFARSTPTGGMRAVVARQHPADAPASISQAVVLAEPSGIYRQAVGPEVVGLAPDPLVADAVWVAQLIGTADPGAADPDYAMRTAQARTFDGATFEPITPLRLLDTRDDTGLPGPFVSGVPRSFQVAGVGAIPADAIAVTANVTVTAQTGAGFVSITPSPTTTPSSSTINFPTGDNRANNITTPLDPTGKVAAVYKAAAGRTTELIVDVTGYFVTGDDGARYKTIAPARLLDSRINNGTTGAFVSGVPKTIQIANRGFVAADAIAITANLTVVNQTRGGFVSITPTPETEPTTSTINFPAGDIRANGLTIPLSSGTVSAVYKASAGATAHLVLDVTGFYVNGASGLRFYALAPGRILDTRATTLTLLTGKFTHGSARTLPVGGHFGAPPDAKAITGNLTVTGQTKGGYVSITQTKTNTPTVSTINFPATDIRANGVTVPLDGGNDLHLVYRASSGATTHLILDMTGYYR